jgi:hypothetical protein
MAFAAQECLFMIVKIQSVTYDSSSAMVKCVIGVSNYLRVQWYLRRTAATGPELLQSIRAFTYRWILPRLLGPLAICCSAE